MNNDSHKRNIIMGTFWSLAGRMGYLVVALVANIILVRFLSPYEFGQVGIVMFFIVIAKVLTESGLSGALIRMKETTEVDYSTVFIFNLLLSLFLMLLLIGFSGPIADFYGDSELKNILRVSSIVLVIYAVQITHVTKLVKRLQFRKKALYEFIAILVASIVAILMAYYGFGVWAIVSLQILTALFLTIVLWVFEEKPSAFTFNKNSFRKLYKFGINTTFFLMLETMFDNIYQVVLGKYFAISQTGLFYQAKKIQEMPLNLLSTLSHSVVFSVLAKIQDEQARFNQLFNRISTALSVLMGFLCLFVFFYAENIIVLLYGQDWIESVFFLQVLILVAYFHVHETFNSIIFKTFDQTQKILYLGIVKKIIQAVSILFGVIFLDLEVLIYGFLLTNILSYCMNIYYSKKEINESANKNLKQSLLVIITGALTAGILYAILSWFSIKGYYSFFLLPVMILCYFGLLKLLRVSDVIQDFKMVKRSMANKG